MNNAGGLPERPASLHARVQEAAQAHQAAEQRGALLIWAAANLEAVCRSQTFVQQHRLGQGEAYIVPFPAEQAQRTASLGKVTPLGGVEVEGVMISSTPSDLPCIFSDKGDKELGYEMVFSPAELAPLDRCRSARELGWHPLGALGDVEEALKATRRLLSARESISLLLVLGALLGGLLGGLLGARLLLGAWLLSPAEYAPWVLAGAALGVVTASLALALLERRQRLALEALLPHWPLADKTREVN